QRLNRGGIFLVRRVDDELPGKIGVEFGHAARGYLMPELRQHLVRWPFQRLASDERTDCQDVRATPAEHLTDSRHRQDRADAEERIARTNQNGICVFERIEHTGRRSGILNPSEAYPAHDRLGAALDEI